MGRFLVCLALAGLARPAAACLNDNELPEHEREFRSQYASRSHLPSPTNRPDYWPEIIGGVGLLCGASALVLRHGRARV